MRLELESTISAPHLAEDAPAENSKADSVEARSALNQGIKAAQAGDRVQARAELLRATELNPRSENAWLWLASISEYPEELLGFLNKVLDINPQNPRALEWRAATYALLSKTFVQRAIDAAQENRKEFASECLQKALEYDDGNADAWLWMASLSDSNSLKVDLLEKALSIEPTNESAISAMTKAKASILKERLAEAKAAAVSGNNAEAISVLDTILATSPESVEAWTMRSHLADGFDEKIRCFESILAIDPDNVAAKAGRDSLLAIFGTVEAANAESNPDSPSVAENAYDVQRPIVYSGVAEPIEESSTEDLDVLSIGFEQASVDSPGEQQYEYESIEEPFGTLTQEAPAPFENTQEPEPLIDINERDKFSSEDPSFTYAGPQDETITFSYDAGIAEPPAPSSKSDYTDAQSDPEIPIPVEALPVTLVQDQTVPNSSDEVREVVNPASESSECPFCGHANEPQAITCHTCMAVLTLSDLELLLGNHTADTTVLRKAIEEMERQRLSREFDSHELVTLGLGHLNLRNLHLGYTCLLDASRLDTNNVVLSGQVNSLLIRLEEIKQQEEAHLKMPKGKAILVVDDSPTIRKLIAGKLEKCGHDVICANDGVEAMERLAHFVPDLILLDITMPRMDGYQVCKSIRSNTVTKDVPVVMISGKDGFFDKVRGRMAGTTGYITKPFGPETLMKAVEMYLSGDFPESEEV